MCHYGLLSVEWAEMANLSIYNLQLDRVCKREWLRMLPEVIVHLYLVHECPLSL